MFGKQLTVVRLFGIDVKIDLSWVFLALLIAWSLAQGFFPILYEGLPVLVYWWMGLAGVIGLLFSLVFHEMAHSLVARRYGLPIRGITLFIFGGVAEMEQEPVRPWAELLMAIAGPIASLFLAAVFFGLSAGAESLGVSEPFVAVTHYLALLNGLLAVFNLVPAFPLDGGRVLRAALWQWTNNLRRATRIASYVGSVFGFVLIGLGILSALTGNLVTGIWWFLIGMFLRGAARGSYYQLIARQVLEGEPVRRFMSKDPVTVAPQTTVQELVENYVYKYHFDLFPVVENQRLVGCVNTRQVKDVEREKWASVKVGEIAHGCTAENTIEPDEDAVKGLSKMQRTGNSRLMVVKEGKLVGIIALKDMLELLALRLELEEK